MTLRRPRRLTRRLRGKVRELWEPVETYRYQVRKGRRAGVVTVDRLSLVRDFVPWLRSRGHTTLSDARPWITFEAARILEGELQPSNRAFEYGSGGSTLFLGRRLAQVVSVEHDPAWFADVRKAAAALPSVELHGVEPRPIVSEEDAGYTSSSADHAGQTFLDYAKVVDAFADGHFDLLIVDGRARPATFFRAEPKVRVGGLVLLDDSERSAYQAVLDAARGAGWRERGRYGPKPFTPWFARTTVWTKTSDLPRRSGRPAASS